MTSNGRQMTAELRGCLFSCSAPACEIVTTPEGRGTKRRLIVVTRLTTQT
jgi:hypothetical protein